MSQLAAQSILELCRTFEIAPMIDPFVDTKQVVNGKSFGLSACSYDVRIAHDLVLGPSPADYMREMILQQASRPPLPTGDVYESQAQHENWSNKRDARMASLLDSLTNLPPSRALAYTVEDFCMPHNVVAYVVDKSSFARVFVSAFNTLMDPGFHGNLTLELVNLGSEIVEYKAGDPVCQIAFHWLDQKTDRPYNGKYQHQTKAAHPARHEALSV